MLGEVLMRLLTEAGHTCRHGENGMEDWGALSPDLKAFDLVITDHEMPDLTGLELVELLHQAGYGGRIVVYSSSLTDADRELSPVWSFSDSVQSCSGE